MKVMCILILFILITGCNETNEPTYDPTSQITGKIVTEENGKLLDSVLVGFKDKNIPDSLVFFQDSVSLGMLPKTFVAPFMFSNNKGQFEFGFAFAAKPPVEYNQMFAFKKGRVLWKFNPSHDTIYHLPGNIDSITIKLKAKK